jgi:hypothetical protein
MERNYIRVGVLPMPPPHLVPPPAPNFFPISVLLEVRENGSVEKICWMQGRGKHLLEVRLGIFLGCMTENFFDVRIGKNFCTVREILPGYKNSKHFI